MPTRAHKLLSDAEKTRLRHLVEAVERETGAEIATFIAPHVDDVEQFATAYFNHLGIGKRERHNGVLILVVVERRQVRIEVGHGLETVVTPGAAKRIIAEVMAPEFRAGRYGDALLRGVEAIADLIRTAPGAPPHSPSPSGGR
jgi:uncharacterized protein